jgi:hypothetical protein
MNGRFNFMTKLFNGETPSWVCSLWVLIELMALRICIGLILWSCVNDTFDCLKKTLWAGFFIFSFVSFLLLILLALTFIRTQRNRIILGIFVFILPLCFWLYIDFSILRPDSIEDLIAGLLMQLSVPIIFTCLLYFDPLLKKYFDSKSYNWIGWQKT